MSDINTIAPTPTDRVGEDVGRLERVRHLKRGTEYEVLGEAEAQVSEGMKRYGMAGATRLISDDDRLTVYRCLKTGKLWARFTDEFRDGRFETIASAPAPSDPAGAGGDLGELERLSKAAAKLIAKWDGAPELPEDMEQALSQFEDAWAWADEFLSNRSGQLVASTPGQKGAGEEKTGAPAPGVQWSAWAETDADSDPSDPGVTYCTEWFVGRWPIGAEEPDCRILIGTSRSAEVIARRVAEKLTSVLNTDVIRAQTPPSPPSATPEGDPQKAVEAFRTAALAAIQDLRHAAACNFSPAYSGPLGEARCDSFYEAYEAIRKLAPSESPSSKEADQ